MKRWQFTAPFSKNKEKKLKKSERLNQELIFLSDKKRFNLQDLMDNFQISKRTALRDIASLEELGLALYAEAGRAGGYSLIQEDLLTKIYFNSDEVAAIFFALKAMEQLKETPFNESFQMISQKLLKNLAAAGLSLTSSGFLLQHPGSSPQPLLAPADGVNPARLPGPGQLQGPASPAATLPTLF